MKQSRFVIVDLMRFTAIALMVIFHLAYDLNAFKFVKIHFYHDPFWYWLPRFIVLLFMLCVGISLAHVHREKRDKGKIKKRFLKISSFAILITVFTYLAFPKNFIYFGTLHCIAIASIIALPFLNKPKISLFLGIFMMVLYWGIGIRFTPSHRGTGIVPMDYIPFHPWFGVVLIGIFLYHQGLHTLLDQKLRPPNWIVWCSTNSLQIYLIHQILLYALVYGAFLLL